MRTPGDPPKLCQESENQNLLNIEAICKYLEKLFTVFLFVKNKGFFKIRNYFMLLISGFNIMFT